VLIIISMTAGICVYLFVTAPPPLAAPPVENATVPTRAVFSMLEAENDAARAMWTEEIVNRGQAVGLQFNESWREPWVEAGPLPALFLRETARNLERSSLRLNLFLGSRFPINTANSFNGQQLERFAALEQTGAPQFFFDRSTSLHTAMFSDRAVVEACVRCHNEHKDSTKTNWQLGAIMGATTWMYPDDAVTVQRAVELVGGLRASIRAAYAGYLKKVSTFAARPEIGDKWPKDGFYLPSEDVFMRELARRSSHVTLRGLLDPSSAVAEQELVVEPIAQAPAKPERKAPRSRSPLLVIRSAKATKVTIDHAGRRLMAARLLAGGTASLTSRPPLHLTISDPDGVQVEYDGKPIELPIQPMPAEGSTEQLDITVGEPAPETM
jgi:hypothetical protein